MKPASVAADDLVVQCRAEGKAFGAEIAATITGGIGGSLDEEAASRIAAEVVACIRRQARIQRSQGAPSLLADAWAKAAFEEARRQMAGIAMQGRAR